MTIGHLPRRRPALSLLIAHRSPSVPSPSVRTRPQGAIPRAVFCGTRVMTEVLDACVDFGAAHQSGSSARRTVVRDLRSALRRSRKESDVPIGSGAFQDARRSMDTDEACVVRN